MNLLKKLNGLDIGRYSAQPFIQTANKLCLLNATTNSVGELCYAYMGWIHSLYELISKILRINVPFLLFKIVFHNQYTVNKVFLFLKRL